MKNMKASNLARLLGQAEAHIAAGRSRPVRSYLRELKNAQKILLDASHIEKE